MRARRHPSGTVGRSGVTSRERDRLDALLRTRSRRDCRAPRAPARRRPGALRQREQRLAVVRAGRGVGRRGPLLEHVVRSRSGGQASDARRSRRPSSSNSSASRMCSVSIEGVLEADRLAQRGLERALRPRAERDLLRPAARLPGRHQGHDLRRGPPRASRRAARTRARPRPSARRSARAAGARCRCGRAPARGLALGEHDRSGAPRLAEALEHHAPPSPAAAEVLAGGLDLLERGGLRDDLEVDHALAERVDPSVPTIACSGTPAWRVRVPISPTILPCERLLVELALAGDHGARGAHALVEAERVEDERRAGLERRAVRGPQPAGQAAGGAGHRHAARVAAGTSRPARPGAAPRRSTISGSAPFWGPNTSGARSHGTCTSQRTTIRAPPRPPASSIASSAPAPPSVVAEPPTATRMTCAPALDGGGDQLARAVGASRPTRRARPRRRGRGRWPTPSPRAPCRRPRAGRSPPRSGGRAGRGRAPRWSRRRGGRAARRACRRRRRRSGRGRAASARRARARGRSRRDLGGAEGALEGVGGDQHGTLGDGHGGIVSRSAPVAPEYEVFEVDGHEVRLSNPGKVYFPRPGWTKGELARYHVECADAILNHIRERPTMLKRFPGGIDAKPIYQKRVPAKRPEWLQTAVLTFPSGRDAEELVPVDAPTSCGPSRSATSTGIRTRSAAQTSTTPTSCGWTSTRCPRRRGTPCARSRCWPARCCDEHGLRGYPRTSGSRGMHITVRIHPRWDFTTVRARRSRWRARSSAAATAWRPRSGGGRSARPRACSSTTTRTPRTTPSRARTSSGRCPTRASPARCGGTRCPTSSRRLTIGTVPARLRERRRPVGRHRRPPRLAGHAAGAGGLSVLDVWSRSGAGVPGRRASPRPAGRRRGGGGRDRAAGVPAGVGRAGGAAGALAGAVARDTVQRELVPRLAVRGAAAPTRGCSRRRWCRTTRPG